MVNTKSVFSDIRNYLAGQHLGATRDDALLDEVLNCMFVKMYCEKNEINIYVNTDAFELSKQVRNIFSQVKMIFPKIFSAEREILLDPASIKYVLEKLNFPLLDSQSDPIGDAFEIFIGSQSKGNSGQFFTPKSATELIVNIIRPKITDKVIDVACGAGGFLATTYNYLQKTNSSDLLSSFVRNNLFGIDKDDYLATLCLTRLALLSGEMANIFSADSLSFMSKDGSIEKELPNEKFDVIITNPPFGTKIVAASEDVMKSFDLAKKWTCDKNGNKYEMTDKVVKGVPPQVLFIERCISLLNENGRLGIVLPESILSSKTYNYVVNYFRTKMSIDAVIGMPESLFKTSGKGGTHTKTCILIARKKTQTKNIYMAEVKWCGQDSRARQIPKNDIPMVMEEYISYIEEKKNPQYGFLIKNSEISNNILCPRYYSNETLEFEEVHKLKYDFVTIQELLDNKIIEYKTGDEVGKLAYGTGNIPFIRTSDLSNWELKSDPKHGVSEEIYNQYKEIQDIQEDDILMVKDGSYLIGTCALITSKDLKIVYQSHLYKLRIINSANSFTPFLLIALLSSSFVQEQIKSKQFTQDIIDSLGDRIKEIKIPLPKSIEERIKISDSVKKIIKLRQEAKKITSEVLSIFG